MNFGNLIFLFFVCTTLWFMFRDIMISIKFWIRFASEKYVPCKRMCFTSCGIASAQFSPGNIDAMHIWRKNNWMAAKMAHNHEQFHRLRLTRWSVEQQHIHFSILISPEEVYIHFWLLLLLRQSGTTAPNITKVK